MTQQTQKFCYQHPRMFCSTEKFHSRQIDGRKGSFKFEITNLCRQTSPNHLATSNPAQPGNNYPVQHYLHLFPVPVKQISRATKTPEGHVSQTLHDGNVPITVSSEPPIPIPSHKKEDLKIHDYRFEAIPLEKPLVDKASGKPPRTPLPGEGQGRARLPLTFLLPRLPTVTGRLAAS